MRPFLDDPPLVHDDQPVHGRNRREPVRNGDHGLALHEIVELLLNGRLDLAVERTRRLIKNQDRRVLQKHTRDRDALTLATRKLYAALADVRVVADAPAQIPELRNELVGCGHARGRHCSLTAGIGTTVKDVVEHRTMQQRSILRHHADAGAQAVLRDVCDVLPIDQNATALQVVEAQQQVDERRFARA
jgi:hypothetical protein